MKIKITNWLEQRKKGIGGSDVSALFGLSPWTSKLKLYLQKTWQIEENEETEIMSFGKGAEEIIAKRFSKETGLKIKKSNFMYSSDEHPFMMGTIDRQIVGEKAILECKYTSYSQWEKIPDQYMLQVQHYIYVSQSTHAYLAVYFGGRKFQYWKIERDDAIISLLIKACTKFWNEHVIPRRPPEVSGSDNHLMNSLYSLSISNAIELPSEFQQLVQQREQLDTSIKQLEDKKDHIDATIKSRMESAEKAVCGDYVIMWGNISATMLDSQKLKKERPEIFIQYAKEKKYRRFSFSKKS